MLFTKGLLDVLGYFFVVVLLGEVNLGVDVVSPVDIIQTRLINFKMFFKKVRERKIEIGVRKLIFLV